MCWSRPEGGIDGACRCPTVRAGIVSTAGVETSVGYSAPDDHFTASPHRRVNESTFGALVMLVGVQVLSVHPSPSDIAGKRIVSIGAAVVVGRCVVRFGSRRSSPAPFPMQRALDVRADSSRALCELSVNYLVVGCQLLSSAPPA